MCLTIWQTSFTFAYGARLGHQKYKSIMRNFITAFLLFSGALACTAQSNYPLLIMPWPKSVKLNGGGFIFTNRFTIGIAGPKSEKILDAANRFYQQAAKRTHLFFSQEYLTEADNRPGAPLTIKFDRMIEPEPGMEKAIR